MTASCERQKLSPARPPRFALLCALAFCVTAPAGGAAPAQERGGRADAPPIPEKVRQQYRWLFEPDFAEIDLGRMLPELNDPPEKLTVPFKAGEKITFRLVVKNASREGKAILVGEAYGHNRPDLYRDGELLPYRRDVEELVGYSDLLFYLDGVRFVSLGPKETFTEIIDLGDWYEPLRPGRYRLAVRHRFIRGGRWLESPPLAFEIVPKKSGAPDGDASTPQGPTDAEARSPSRSAVGRRP